MKTHIKTLVPAVIIKLLVVIFISTTLFASCSKTGGSPQSGTDSSTNRPSTVTIGTINGGLGVYAAGYEDFYNIGSDNLPISAGSRRVAKIWKDGVPSNMTDGRFDAIASAVFANGTDVYAVGFERNADSVQVATLWKNAKSIRLGDGKNNSVANSVYVYGSDVYIVGNTISNNISSATIWKNGLASTLNNGAVANSVFVAGGGDVYACGSDGTGAAMLWKNGVGMSLVNGGLGDANSVYVLGGDVYVAGTFENNGVLPGYWKNGKFALLNYSSGAAKSVYAVGNKVLIAGFVTTDPVLWVDGKATALTDPLSAAPAAGTTSYFALTSVSGNGNHVRVAGYRTTHVSGQSGTAHDTYAPILFTDGSSQTLDNGDTQATLSLFKKTGGRALSVFVVAPA